VSAPVRFLIILPLDLIIECAVLIACKYLLLKKSFQPVPSLTVVLAGIVATSLTLPYVWFIIPFFIRDRILYLIVSETFAVLVEGFLFCFLLKLKVRMGLLVSLVANAASFIALYFADFLLARVSL
jgi:hypothetical protein